ncbi:pyruvate, phosphate dikinase [Nocardioides sp. NPDC127514]
MIYRVGTDHDPGRATTGGKAASLFRMTGLDLNVPAAFVIPTQVCHDYLEHGALNEQVLAEIRRGVGWLESEMGRTFGGPDPLLVSVRSGAAISMPGMMDTVLNLGINDRVAAELARSSGDDHARETLRRFRSCYRSVVLDGGDGKIPDDPWEQLTSAVGAVFASWNSPRAVAYRNRAGISHELGTAVTVQAMVLGHRDEKSGTGVVFSRDPLSGERTLFGEWLPSAQGEALVGGEVNGQPLSALREVLPDAYAELAAGVELLERTGRDIQDVEFTVESGKLWLLQARSAKRSALAAARSAVEMVTEGLIEPLTALDRVTADQVRALARPVIGESTRREAVELASGEPACPGVGIGLVAASSAEVEAVTSEGTDAVLARESTSPEEFIGMSLANGVMTGVGGATSHAAVVSRELGVPCVVGCGAGTVTALAGRVVTVDGTTGKVYDGALPLETYDETTDENLQMLFSWARELAPLPVLHPDEVPDGVEVRDLTDGPGQGAWAARSAVFDEPTDSATEVAEALRLGASAIVTTGRRLPLLLEVLSSSNIAMASH